MGALNNQLLIQILIKKIDLSKELFLLEIEEGKETCVSDDLSQR